MSNAKNLRQMERYKIFPRPKSFYLRKPEVSIRKIKDLIYEDETAISLGYRKTKKLKSCDQPIYTPKLPRECPNLLNDYLKCGGASISIEKI